MTKYDSKKFKRKVTFFALTGRTGMSKQPWRVVCARNRIHFGREWITGFMRRGGHQVLTEVSIIALATFTTGADFHLASSQSLEACSSATASATLSLDRCDSIGPKKSKEFPNPETPREKWSESNIFSSKPVTACACDCL